MTRGVPASLFGIGSRLPPASLEAEQALLGALLANNKAYERVGTIIAPEHFADAIHGRIYSAIRRRIEAGKLADAVTLRVEFDNSGELQEVGGGAYLAQLLGAMVGIINAGEYAKLIRDCFIRRQVIDLATDAIDRCYSSEPTDEVGGEAIIEELESSLLSLGRENADPNAGSFDNNSVIQQCAEDLQRAMANPDVPMGIPTGLKALDTWIGGLQPKKFYLVAGATSMGKSALAAKMKLASGKAGYYCDYVSGEMEPREIMHRMVAMEARQPLSAVEKGFIECGDGRVYRFGPSSKEMREIGEAQRAISLMPGTWLDAGGPLLSSLVARWRLLKRQKKLDLIIVDYLQLVRASPQASKDLRMALTEITQTLKQVAKQLDVPVVALSQLKRGVQEREMRRPQLSDLKESGSLEQDADVVIFLYREHYYLTRSKPTQKDKESPADYNQRVDEWKNRVAETAGKADIDVAKQRGGKTGLIPVAFIDHLTCFEDLPDHG